MAKNKNKNNKIKTVPSGIRLENLKRVEPLTKTQKEVFQAYKKGNHLCLSGSAGTGKTFLGMYLALEELLSNESAYNKLVIVRSAVPTRDMGFLPGDRLEKEATYLAPYQSITGELFGEYHAWSKLISEDKVEFLTTSFIRGITLRKAIVLVDEMQNLTFHELDSVITRLGEDCRIIFCGDYYQTDLEKNKDKSGIIEFMAIIEKMKYFHLAEFGWQDIVRSGLVRDYIMTKEMEKKK